MSQQSSAYLIVQLEIPDLETYLTEYGMPLIPILSRYGAEVLVATPEPKVLEGSYDHTFTVVVKFPSAEAVESWYKSPEYQPLKAKRAALTNPSSTCVVVVPTFEGLPA